MFGKINDYILMCEERGRISFISTQRKQRENKGRLHKNGKGQDSFSLREVEEEGYKEKGERIKRNGVSNQHL